MKYYQEYMDSVGVSPEFHEKLTHLTAPQRAIPWRKYGAAAAALVLIVGLGAFGINRLGNSGQDAVLEDSTEIGEVDVFEDNTDIGYRDDIANEGKTGVEDDAPATIGSYEVADGETVSCYLLPSIVYGWADYMQTTDVGWSWGKTLTKEEIFTLLGGEEALSVHLDWDSTSLDGYAALSEDGSIAQVELSGLSPDGSCFTLSLAPDKLPVTCALYPEAEVNQLYGVEISASGFDWEDSSVRRVSFLTGGQGYCFEISGSDSQALELLVSRFVRYVCDDLAAVDFGVLTGENITERTHAAETGGGTSGSQSSAASTPSSSGTTASSCVISDWTDGTRTAEAWVLTEDVTALRSFLDKLTYQAYTSDGVPEYSISFDDGATYDVNLSEGWVWLEKDSEAALSQELTEKLQALMELE